MANETQLRYIGTIQRALGIIEGVAAGMPNEDARQMLYTATEMIDEAMEEITDGK